MQNKPLRVVCTKGAIFMEKKSVSLPNFEQKLEEKPGRGGIGEVLPTTRPRCRMPRALGSSSLIRKFHIEALHLHCVPCKTQCYQGRRWKKWILAMVWGCLRVERGGGCRVFFVFTWKPFQMVVRRNLHPDQMQPGSSRLVSAAGQTQELVGGKKSLNQGFHYKKLLSTK